MRRLILTLLVLAMVLTFAGIVRSEDAAKWAATHGAGKESFTFVVFGDSCRTSPNRSIPDVLGRILQEIALLHPDFAVHTGDFIVGYTDNKEQAREEFMTFIKKVYEYAPDVDFLFVPGFRRSCQHIS